MLVDDLLAACADPPDPAFLLEVDPTRTCKVLVDWDRTFNLDSSGAVLFREWLSRYSGDDLTRTGILLAREFDPADPIGTPATLADVDVALANLAAAIAVLETAGLPLDVTLGELQFADRNGLRVPIHGGTEQEGVTNKVLWGAQNTTTAL